MTFEIGINPAIAHFGALTLTWHGLFTALAIFVAFGIGIRATRKAGLAEDAVTSLMIWAMVGGVIGARAFYYLDHPSLLRENPLDFFAIWQGGIAAYGAFIGGIVAGVIRARRLRLDPWPLLDLVAPALLVGQAIGRLGCLSNGDAWGGPTSNGWGVVYTNQDALLPSSLIGVPTHPYPLYEIVWDLAVLGVVLLLWSRLGQAGNRFLMVAVGYAIGRFFLSFVRQEPIVMFGLQEAQVVALLTGGAALIALVWKLWRSRTPKLARASEGIHQTL